VTSVAPSQPPGQFYCPTCEKTFDVGVVRDNSSCPNDGTRLLRLKVADPLVGRVLDNRYTILEKLGQGGMGAVYRGNQHSVGREVAIKLVTPQLITDSDVIKRFSREAKLASKLSHPNAVGVLDFGQTDDGLFYLVMELVVGKTLDQIIKAERQLSPERIVRIGTQVCDALEGAHALQIVHRDLKPANIMLLAQGRDIVKVLDFGLAKSLAPDQTSTTMTSAGSLLGTPAFMPPELALGQPCDGRADLYSLGCILYLMGSGRLPFVSESAHELIAMHGTQQAPPMTGVPDALAHVIDRLLEKEPNRRFQTAAETREALEASLGQRIATPVSGVTRMSQPSLSPQQISAFVSSDTIAAVPASTISPAKKRNVLGPVLGALALVIGGVVAFALTRHGDKPVTPQPAEVVEQPKPTPTPTPVVDTPVQAPAEAPVVEKPVVEKPAVEKPVVEKHTVEKPVVKKPVKKPSRPTTKPTTTQQVTGSGSASKPALPF
jgi:serine/threonine-protein kinase